MLFRSDLEKAFRAQKATHQLQNMAEDRKNLVQVTWLTPLTRASEPFATRAVFLSKEVDVKPLQNYYLVPEEMMPKPEP